MKRSAAPMSRKLIKQAAERKAASARDREVVHLLEAMIADEDADSFNLAAAIVEDQGVVGCLHIAGIAHRAIMNLAMEWGVTPAEALAKVAAPPRHARP